MAYLILGLVLFLGLHLTRVFAEGWRTQRIAAWGANGWKGFNSLLSIIGFALICYGYGVARQAPIDLWMPPLWTRHVTALLTLPVFIMLATALLVWVTPARIWSPRALDWFDAVGLAVYSVFGAWKSMSLGIDLLPAPAEQNAPDMVTAHPAIATEYHAA